jgi:hypothetical protein
MKIVLLQCATGALDLATTGDGRFPGSWTALQCDVGNTGFFYSFQGSNSYYVKLSVTNTRVPVSAVALEIGGQFVDMQATSDAYFILFSGLPINFPTSVMVTSILGDTVTDMIPATSVTGPPVQGTAQFPLHPSIESVMAGTTASTESELPIGAPSPFSTLRKGGAPVSAPAPSIALLSNNTNCSIPIAAENQVRHAIHSSHQNPIMC